MSSNNRAFEKPTTPLFNAKEFKLEPGKFYVGYIAYYAPKNHTIFVNIENTKRKAWWVAGVFSGLSGIKMNYTPELGTKVLCLIGDKIDQVFIVGTLPNGVTLPALRNKLNGISVENINSYESLAEIFDKNNSQFQSTSDRYENTTPGEFDIQNSYGVSLQILRNVAKLSAGQLASIECFVIDDMVRIVSDSFQHFNAFGEHVIYNDNGKLNVRWDGALKDFEAFGQTEEQGQPKAERKGTHNFEMTPDNLQELGRWRFSSFIGHLGNFMHMFITDPVNEMGRLLGDDEPTEDDLRSGRFHAHVNTDGSVLVRSVSDIVFEKVVRIPVPIERRKPNDRTGNQMLNPDDIAEFANFDPMANWKPTNNLYETVYMMRDYAKWFSNFYSYAQFLSQHKDWYVPTEEDTPQADKDFNDREKRQRNPEYSDELHTQYINKYATIRMFKDGSILLLDADNSAVTMLNGNVSISAKKNIELEAGDNINLISRNINMVAKENIDATAVEGGMLLRSQRWMQMLCRRGTTLIESEANASNTDATSRYYDNSGVIIKSSTGNVGIHATAGSIKLNAINIVNKANVMFNQVRQFVVGKVFSISAGASTGVLNLIGNLRAGTILGQRVSSQLEILRPGANGSLHGNHIGFHTGNDPEVTAVNTDVVEFADSKLPAAARFIHRDTYNVTETYESLTQQSIRLDEDPSDFDVWTFAVNGDEVIKYPYPGKNVSVKQYNPVTAGAKNDTPSTVTEYPNEGNDFTKTGLNIRTTKNN